MDPYGRAKTVRIGKWRWPPPRNHDDPTTVVPMTGSFLEFKMQKNQQKKVSNDNDKTHSQFHGLNLISLNI
jgi:hypothetical protein